MCNFFSLWAEPINKALFLLHERKSDLFKATKPPGQAKNVQQFPLLSEVSMNFHGHL